MRLVSLILLIACLVLLINHCTKKIDNAYRRGYIDGSASVKQPNLDKECAAWWLGTNIKDAKKRLCAK